MSHIKSDKFLPYGRQVIDDDDIKAVSDVLKNDFLTTGPAVAAFEAELVKATSSKHAIAVGNGTQALHLACLAAGIGPGDAAIVPSVTFLATANAVRYCGADVIFADVDPITGLVRAQDIEKAIADNPDKKIKAVLPVHLAGQPVDLAAVRKLADRHNLKIIADSCHAVGGIANDAPIGACRYEDMAVFSFHPVKTVAMGEGGAITTNDADADQLMRKLRSHGMSPNPQVGPWAYDMDQLGYNYRVTDIQCALGLSQLKKLKDFIKKREQLTKLYDQLLSSFNPVIKPPKRVLNAGTGWHLYAARFDFEAIGISRADFMNRLKNDFNIGTQVHYIPVHTQPYYVDLYGEKDLPGAQAYYSKTLSLPLFSSMGNSDVERVVSAINSILKMSA